MIRILLLMSLLASGNCLAQQLWGSLAQASSADKQGKYTVGFKVIRERDNARGNRPMLVSLWYPGKPSATAKSVLFRDYFVDAGGAEDFQRTMERPFIANAKISDENFNRVLDLATAAKWNLAEANGKFPAVLMSSETESLSVTAEYLASNGFVVAAVNAPYDQQQPADSLLWVQPTEDFRWLVNYTKTLRNIDQAKLTCLGFGGGIQSPFYLTMKSDNIKALVNLDGGVFGPRSLTNKSIEYKPANMKTPMLHIVSSYQRHEDDVRQQEALVNTRLFRAFIQHEGLYHHDFSIYGRVLNKGLKMRGPLGDIADQTYAAAHRLILEFLQLAVAGKANSFVIDQRYMPFISLEAHELEPGLVYYEPSMDNAIIDRGKKFRVVNDTILGFDIYYPPAFDGKHDLPVVVFVNGAGIMELYRWRIYKDWAKLIAAHGMIAVTYQARRDHEMEDSDFFLDYLSAHASELAIDKEKIGLWSCSANVGVGLPLAMQQKRTDVKALVVYYGSSQAVSTYRQGLEMQVVRSGLDFYNLNIGMENFVKQALVQDLHFEFINYPEGQHAFDAFDNTPRSREIILQTVAFLDRVLSKDHPVPAASVLTNGRIWNMIIDQRRVDETLKEWKEAVAMYRAMKHSQWYNHVIDERNLNQVGYKLLEAGRTDDAIKVFKANLEQFPNSADAKKALEELGKRK